MLVPKGFLSGHQPVVMVLEHIQVQYLPADKLILSDMPVSVLLSWFGLLQYGHSIV